MVNNSKTFTFYWYKQVGTDEEERAAVEIQGPDKTASLDRNNVEALANDFSASGWRIEKGDKLETVSPIVLNQWAPRPWNSTYGVETLVGDGEMILFRGFSPVDLDSFYRTYRSLSK